MPSVEYENSKMELTITNMKINVVEPMTTNSWKLTTMNGVYQIDHIPDDMTLTFKCDYPCLSCNKKHPDRCTECNTVEVDMILYESKCYETCPDGTFFEYFYCKPCDSKCKTCEYLSGSSCTTCDSSSAYPYLNGKDCTATCNYGDYGNDATSVCEKCEVPCETCTETPNKCLSCR